MRIAIVAGEASGDLLGAEIVTALRHFFPQAEFIGVAGSKMLNAGVQSLFPLEKLSVMGFTEVLFRLRELLTLRAKVKQTFLQNPPDVYIGVDAPDFNLPIEMQLKKAGIKTVHCNSPTIWAWRKKRILKIGRAVDLMLTLFPFEPPYYEAANIPVKYIGHPLADLIPYQLDVLAAKQKLNLPNEKKIIALLPGSRQGEIKYIGPVLLQAAKLFLQRYPETIFIAPMINQKRYDQFQHQHEMLTPELPLKLFLNQSHNVMAAADAILLASGTATLEAMLCKKPMVVVYRASAISAWIAKRLVKIKHFSLPNILANEELVPEFFQEAATPKNVVSALFNYLEHPEKVDNLVRRFLEIHQQLRCGASEKAAVAINRLLGGSDQI